MLANLLNEKPWAVDWPEIISAGFAPVILTAPPGESLSAILMKVNPVIQALRHEGHYSRNKIIEHFQQLSSWSQEAAHFLYPPTEEGWNREFLQLCAISCLQGKTSQVFPVLLASCYPQASFNALRDFSSQGNLAPAQQDFMTQLRNSLSQNLNLGVEASTTIMPELDSVPAPVASTVGMPSKPTTSVTPATPRHRPPAILEKLQKWAGSLHEGEWDDARKSEWLDSKRKWAFEQSEESQKDVWFERELLPAFAALEIAQIDTLMKYWPVGAIALRRPIDLFQSPRFWGILKNSAPGVREKMFEEVLPRVVRFGPLSTKDKILVGQEMIRMTTSNQDEFVRRLRLWEKLGGELDGVAIPEGNPNVSLFGEGSGDQETLRNWIVSQKNDVWVEGLKQLSPSPRLKM